jgi:hypothetical protein
MAELIPNEIIESRIFIIRGQKVMLDRDLAELYGVSTKRLNEQVKRNLSRFPQDFMFKLNEIETRQLVANCDRFKTLKHSSSFPYAFTEHGTIMLASIINSEVAISVNIQIVRAFIRLREIILTHKDLQKKIDDIIRVHGGQLKDHAEKIRAIFQLINQLLEPPTEAQKKKYGFLADRE